MHLVYLDESGNTGNDFENADQPVFALCAMVVSEDAWHPLEKDLIALLDKHFPTWKSVENFEVHASDIRRGTRFFAGVPVGDRVKFRDAWMTAGKAHGVRLIYRAVHKKRYAVWLKNKFGQGVEINPQVAAFALLSPCICKYLASLPGKPRGMFIFDENKQVMTDMEKSIKLLKDEVSAIRMEGIIEKGFFIDSKKSKVLQLCDLFTLSLRKRQERRYKLGAAKTVDDSGIEIAEKLLFEDGRQDSDMIAWLEKQHKPTTVATVAVLAPITAPTPPAAAPPAAAAGETIK